MLLLLIQWLIAWSEVISFVNKITATGVNENLAFLCVGQMLIIGCMLEKNYRQRKGDKDEF